MTALFSLASQADALPSMVSLTRDSSANSGTDSPP